MTSTILISGKTVGSKKPLFADWSVPYPPDLNAGGDRITLRDLITRVVQAEVEAFRVRQQERRLERVLSRGQIEQAAARGRVDMGGRNLKQKVDEEQAVGTALQAFEDGIYLVLVDDEQHQQLDSEVYLRPDSRVTFLRLTMLAGG